MIIEDLHGYVSSQHKIARAQAVTPLANFRWSFQTDKTNQKTVTSLLQLFRRKAIDHVNVTL